MRRVARIALGSFALVLALAGGLFARGWYLVHRSHDNPPSRVVAARDPESVERGRHLVQTVLGCGGCHASRADEIASQGNVSIAEIDGNPENFAAGFGRIYARHLSPVGDFAEWSDGEIGRAIREGVGRDGRALIGMPSLYYRNISDDHLADILAYLRQLPPVARELPPREIAALGYLLGGLGIFESAAQPPIDAPIVAPPEGDDAAYGAYLLAINDCADCHGPGLRGGERLPGDPYPVGPNLTTLAARGWDVEAFVQAIRTGRTVDGASLDPTRMPWPLWSHLRGGELRALARAVLALPAEPDREPGWIARVASWLG